MRSGSTTSGALSTSLRSLQKVTTVWLLLQQTAAAVLAWLIATAVVGHTDPFFAPVAAIVALNATLGERGSNAVRMLLGVAVGIVVGEITIALMGNGHGRLAIATFTAMAIASRLNTNRIVIAQAAASAILTVVALERGTAGLGRMVDAIIGGGVALVFTQVLFTPEPTRLIRRAERAGLSAIAAILDQTAEALEHDDAALAERTMDQMQLVRNQLLDVERTRHIGAKVRRRSVAWQSRARRAAVEHERVRARRLDLLGGSCLMLVRLCVATHPMGSRSLAPSIRELAGAIGDLATRLDEPGAHDSVATRVLELARTLVRGGQHLRSPLAISTMLLEIIALDFMAFAGIDTDKTVAAMLPES